MTATVDVAAPSTTGFDPARVLAELAPKVVPTLYDVGERTWPRAREARRKKWGVVGPEITVRETMPRRFAVLLRKCDLTRLAACWRLEVGGPVEFFEWDASGRVHGTYGVRYPVISVAPVIDESGRPSGFAVNARASTDRNGLVRAVDARVDSDAYVRSTNPDELISALKSVSGKPRTEEFRPGMEPTPELFKTLRMENKTGYFQRRGANEYIGPGWSPQTVEDAIAAPWVRALVIGHPNEPSLTPEPAEH